MLGATSTMSLIYHEFVGHIFTNLMQNFPEIQLFVFRTYTIFGEDQLCNITVTMSTV